LFLAVGEAGFAWAEGKGWKRTQPMARAASDSVRVVFETADGWESSLGGGSNVMVELRLP